VIKDLENRNLSYAIVENFLSDLKEEFGGRDNETMKVAPIEEGRIEKFVQKFRKAVRRSRYEERLLVEKFKRGMNRLIL